MPRPRTFDVEQVLDAATDVFWRKGYAATTPQDLCDATGLGRGSLYNAFAGKRELFDRVLERYNQRGAVAQLDVLDGPKPVKERIRDLLMLTMHNDQAGVRRAGCLAVSTAVQMCGNDDQLTAVLRKRFSETETALVAAIEFGQAEMEIRDDVPARRLARLVISAMYGMTVLNDVFADRRRLRDVVEAAVAVL
ncbi:TetR/AcrR family transcriptional regulator [Fodinicola acaciae]|uniref:TetR/AcrR family transcriptional regulator n=1 Tax=Fodinicola acaciae TaxID=2681555 RepID=UPI0013D22FC5|nr:TetR/AcrR family transcriptional regulator [Fodinicola acaciae]